MRKYPTASENQHLHQSTPMSRRSFITTSTVTSLAISNSLFGVLAARVAPVEQPDQFIPLDQSSLVNQREIPDPNEPIDTILHNLRTPQEYQAFVEMHTTFDTPSFPVEFFSTYRRSPEEFQKAGWKGCCNDYAELACNWAYRHRCTPYIVSICPQGVLGPMTKGWHQFAAVNVEEDAYVIFDNTNVIFWNGNIEEYIAKHHNTCTLLPYGGCVPWQNTQDNWTARMAYQSVPNTTRFEQSSLPNVSVQSMVQLAAKD